MRSSSLIRWSGTASLLGFTLLAVHIALSFTLGQAQGTENPYEIYSPLRYVIDNLLFNAALLLFVLSVAGFHIRRAERIGALQKTALFLALGASVALILSSLATFMVVLRLEFASPLVLYMQLVALTLLLVNLVSLGLAAIRLAALRDWKSSMRKRWVLLILAAGVGAALISDILQEIFTKDIPRLNMPGTHVLHVLVTIPVAIWVARKIATAPVLYGALVGLISGIINQIYFHVLVEPGTLKSYEAVLIITLSVVAGWIGGLVARSTLSEQVTLYRVSQAIGEASDLQEIVDTIGERLADPQVSHVALWEDLSERNDGAGAEFSLLAVWMPPVARIWGPGVWRHGLRLGATHVPALAHLGQQSPLVLRVSKLPASERAIWEHQGIRSIVLLPLIAPSGTRLGLLMVASRGAYAFPRAKLRTYLTLSAQVALMLENFRLVEQAQRTGVSQERQRLANEIHDTLAQGFTSIVMNLEAAEGMLPSQVGAALEYLDQARTIARESLAEARRVMWALRPESLERSSLPETLARHAESWSEESGVAASVTVTGTPHALTPEIEVTLLRVAQEALNNCRKYARASQVVITISYMNNLVVLNVQDDGVGFDPDRLPTTEPEAESTGGFGLLGMRERIAHLRGTLLVESAPGEGCTLMAAIPVPADKGAPGGAEAARAVPPST